MDYVPFDASPEEIEERQVLRDGVPESMRPALIAWLYTTMRPQSGYVRREKFDELSNNLDLTFGLPEDFTGSLRSDECRTLLGRVNDRQLLRIADYLLFAESSFPMHHDALGSVLTQGRSKYQVAKRGKGYRLEERVPEGVKVAAEAIISSGTTAGRLLERAWMKVFDLTPDDSGAYSHAVKAVETVALDTLGITKETATVSDAIRAIEKRESAWRLPFQREHTEYPSRNVLLGMLKSLYRGQRDRHGSEAYSDVTHDEAQAAVLMAVTLVGWFSGGLVQERDAEAFG